MDSLLKCCMCCAGRGLAGRWAYSLVKLYFNGKLAMLVAFVCFVLFSPSSWAVFSEINFLISCSELKTEHPHSWSENQVEVAGLIFRIPFNFFVVGIVGNILGNPEPWFPFTQFFQKINHPCPASLWGEIHLSDQDGDESKSGHFNSS